MRQIKFRCWDSENEVMAEVDELFGDFDFIKDGDRVRSTASWQCVFNGDYPALVPMQYTGLKDKNGKYIYEGDLVKDNSTVFEIHWKKGGFDFKRISGAYQSPYFGDNCARMEIIGNIYENPELLPTMIEEEKSK